jgi:hypothetical protein
MRLEALTTVPLAWTAHGLRFTQEKLTGADVQLAFGPLPQRLDHPVTWGQRRDAGPGDWLIRLEPGQRMRATDGTVITLDAPADADQTMLARWVEGPATAAILYQRGILPLHASAVLIDGALVAFLAPSGTGKSSLAAACVAEGAVPLTDDLLAIHLDSDGTPLGSPGSGHLRIPPSTWAELDTPSFRVTRTDLDGKVVVTPVRPQGVLSSPLAAAFLLETGDRFEISALTGFDSLAGLRRQVARPSLARTTGTEAAIFSVLGRLAGHVPVWRLIRPRTGWTLGPVQRAVRDCLATLAATSTSSPVSTP